MAQFYADRVAVGSHRAISPEGYLVCLGIPFARTGFQIYKASELGLKGDGKVKVYRRYDEVFNPVTLSSFEGKSITSPHPPQFLNPNNDKEYSMGHIQNVRQGPQLADGEHALLGDIVIKDSRLISKIESGSLEELSAGYECEYEPDANAPDIYYQTLIRGNHVAVVPTGRAGNNVKILDSDTTKEESTVAEAATAAVDDKVSVGALTGLLRLLGIGGSRLTVDSDPGAVERNEEAAKKAKERAVNRNEDGGEAELEKEEKGAKPPNDKKAKDADEERKERKEMKDAISRLTDAVEELNKKKEKKEGEDAEEEEKKLKGKKEEEDSDLIPVATLSTENRPKNPIPGADKATDAARVLNGLLAIKSLVADSGDAASVLAWNDAVRALKGKKKSNDGYADLSHPSNKSAREATERAGAMRVQDATEIRDEFIETCQLYLGKNVKEGAQAAAEARKEKK